MDISLKWKKIMKSKSKRTEIWLNNHVKIINMIRDNNLTAHKEIVQKLKVNGIFYLL